MADETEKVVDTKTIKSGEFAPISNVPIVAQVRKLLEMLRDGLPMVLEQVVSRDLERLEILINARLATLSAPEQEAVRKAFGAMRLEIKEKFDGAMDRATDARTATTGRIRGSN